MHISGLETQAKSHSLSFRLRVFEKTVPRKSWLVFLDIPRLVDFTTQELLCFLVSLPRFSKEIHFVLLQATCLFLNCFLFL